MGVSLGEEKLLQHSILGIFDIIHYNIPAHLIFCQYGQYREGSSDTYVSIAQNKYFIFTF